MSRIRRALRIDPDTVRTVVDHLDRHVAPPVALAGRGLAPHRPRNRSGHRALHPRRHRDRLAPRRVLRAHDSANGRPLDPVSLRLSGGEVLDFDCKHRHRVLDADPARWSVVLWRIKRHPRRPVAPTRIP